jgi:hypothetical protein
MEMQTRRLVGVHLRISFTVRWSDFIWMYLGSWGPRIAAIPGIVMMLIPIGRAAPLTTYLFFEVGGLAVALVSFTYVCVGLLGWNNVARVVGKAVALEIDDNGVSGWPLGGDLDSSWWRIRKAYRLHGVTVLPFRNYGTRAAWVPIPDRALTTDQLDQLRELLVAKGLMKPNRQDTRRG